MRKVTGITSLVLILLLLLFSEQALYCAKNALEIWWNAVLPSLFPFYVLISLLNDGGLLPVFCRIAGRLFPGSDALQKGIPGFVLGALSGFPTGARLCGMMGRSDLAAYCNLCSPIFLLGVISANLANDVRLFLPICIAHYGSAAILFLLSLSWQKNPSNPQTNPHFSTASAGLLPGIAKGMTAMLCIGGSIVFFSVLSAILEQVGLIPLITNGLQRFGIDTGVTSAVLKGMLEMTSGCAAVSTLTVSVRLSAALYAALVSFGGVCILVQAKMECEEIHPLRYLFAKSIQAVLAGIAAFWLTPLFLSSDAPVIQFPEACTILRNTASGLALFTAALVGVFSAYVVSVCLLQFDKRTEARASVRSLTK